MLETAAFLRESEEVDNKQWCKFSGRFFLEYRDTIMQYYGYESQIFNLPLRDVHYPRFFIALMSVLLKLGIIGCNPTELTNTLYGAFRFSQERSTVRKWFYEIPPEYEDVLTKFKCLFSTLKFKK